MIGTYRIVPKGTIIWSIPHQTTLITNGDELVKITHTTQSSSVFVEPSQEIFNFGPFIPSVIGKGKGEWEVDYEKTIPWK